MKISFKMDGHEDTGRVTKGIYFIMQEAIKLIRWLRMHYEIGDTLFSRSKNAAKV